MILMDVNSSRVAMITEFNQMNEYVPFQFEFVDSNAYAGRLVPSHHGDKWSICLSLFQVSRPLFSVNAVDDMPLETKLANLHFKLLPTQFENADQPLESDLLLS